MTRIGFLAALALAVSCGGGAEVLGPSRYDLGPLDAADAGRDPGRDPGREVPGPDAVDAADGDDPGDPGGDDAADPDAGDAEDPDAGDPSPDPAPDGDAAAPDDAPAPLDDGDAPAPDDAPGTPDEGVGPTDDGPGDEGPRDPGPRPDDGGPPPDPGPDGTASPLSIRFVAANLTSGSAQSYDPGHGIRLMKSLRADVLLVQEFNYGANGTADYRQMTDEICGPECAWSVGDGSIPNGVVARWPIVEHGAWDDPNISNRDLDWARIDLPGAKDLVAVSVHLHTSPAGDQVEAAQVVAREIAAYRAAHPGCCWYVVGGDFNGPAAVDRDGFGEYDGEDIFSVTGPHPLGQDGTPYTNRNRNDLYDWVLLDLELRAFQVPSEFPADDGGPPLAYPAGLVFDTRDFSQAELDDHFPPALTGDSSASNMQHMAVVKDVRVP